MKPPLSVDCCDTLGLDRAEFCPEGRRSLKSETGTHLTGLRVEYLPGYKPVHIEVDEMMEDIEDIEEYEKDIRDTLDAMMVNVNSIMMKLNMDPEVLDPMNESKSKKSKKAKQTKPATTQEESKAEDNLFHRALLDDFDETKTDIVAAVKEEVKSVESQVESIATTKDDVKDMKSKVESMESKVESIEGKVESIEKTMDDIRYMLSQLVMREADVA